AGGRLYGRRRVGGREDLRHVCRVCRGSARSRGGQGGVSGGGAHDGPSAAALVRQSERTAVGGSGLEHDHVAELRRVQCRLKLTPRRYGDRLSRRRRERGVYVALQQARLGGSSTLPGRRSAREEEQQPRTTG